MNLKSWVPTSLTALFPCREKIRKPEKLLAKIFLVLPDRWMTVNNLLRLLFFNLLVGFTSAHSEEERWISVKGRGTVESAPDLAILQLGVISVAKTASLATETNNRSIRAVFDKLSAAGVDDKHMQTLNFTLNPQRQYRNNQPPLITGFQASNSILIEIHDLAKVGEVMQAAIDAGGNNFQSLTFAIDDPAEQQEEARRLAVEDAVQRAEVLTESLNVKVGEPLTIQELNFSHHPVHNRRMMMADAMAMESSSVPVQSPKDLTTTVEVQIKFSLE